MRILFSLSLFSERVKITGYRKFNINKAKKYTGYDCENYIKTGDSYCKNIRIDAKTGFLS